MSITTAPRQSVACAPRAHAHRACEGCGAPCGPDDGWKTTTRRVWVCGNCVNRYRGTWMRGEK